MHIYSNTLVIANFAVLDEKINVILITVGEGESGKLFARKKTWDVNVKLRRGIIIFLSRYGLPQNGTGDDCR